MTEFSELQATAGELYRTKEMKQWLFAHTRDEAEYNQLRRTLRVLAHWKPVEWQGKTGERRPVECGNARRMNDMICSHNSELMTISVQGGDE